MFCWPMNDKQGLGEIGGTLHSYVTFCGFILFGVGYFYYWPIIYSTGIEKHYPVWVDVCIHD